MSTAKQWLIDNGYTVLDQNLNEKADAALSEKRSVYLGYKTTTDKDKAITDMRAMNMNGDYSYDEYEELLENKKTEIGSFISNMKAALAEYRQNYKKGVTKAKVANLKLENYRYTFDQGGAVYLESMLLEPLKEEVSEEEYNDHPQAHIDMTTLIMQGNIEYVGNVMSLLSLAADISKQTWLDRLKKSKGFDGLLERYEEDYPALSDSKINTLLVNDYDEKSKTLAGKLVKLRESLKAYTECPVKAEDDEARVEAYFNEHKDKSKAEWSSAGIIYKIMSDIRYEDGTLLDLLDGTKYDFDKLEDRMVLYPIIDTLSEGQCALLSYIDLGELLITGNMTQSAWNKMYEDTVEDNYYSDEVYSVYEGVDRSLFRPGKIALTSEARQLQSSTGSSYVNKLMGINTTYIQIAGYSLSVLLLGAGIASLKKAGSLKPVAEAAYNEIGAVSNDLAAKTKTAADQFNTYLTSKNIEFFNSIPVNDETLRGAIFKQLVEKAQDKANGAEGHFDTCLYEGCR